MSTTPPLSATSENLASRVIDFVRFPLIVLVVTIHVPIERFAPAGSLQNFPVADLFNDLIGDGIARVAVPLFFFISGYLFFLRGSSFPCSLYFNKLKRRFWSLFVPMVVWGTPLFIAKCLAWKLSPGLFQLLTFDYPSVTEFAHDLFVRGILACEIVPFWFIRGLIIACLLSPLWFFLLKKFKFIPLILFGIWYCFFPFPDKLPEMTYPFGAVVVFFFCFGAYFSIHEIDFTKVFRKIRIPFFVVYPIFLVGNAMLRLFDFAELYDKTKNIEVVVGLVAAVALVSIFLEKRPDLRIPKTLRDATFFVFAGHTILFLFTPKVVAFFPSLFPCETSLGIIVAFLGATLFAVLACVLLSILVRKFAPWSIRFLTGGR